MLCWTVSLKECIHALPGFTAVVCAFQSLTDVRQTWGTQVSSCTSCRGMSDWYMAKIQHHGKNVLAAQEDP
jgi:hypothetical protein